MKCLLLVILLTDLALKLKDLIIWRVIIDVRFLFKTDDRNQVERKAPFTSLCCLFIHSNFLCSRALQWKLHCQDTCLAFKVLELQSRDPTLTLRSNMNYSDVKHWSSQVIIKSRFLSNNPPKRLKPRLAHKAAAIEGMLSELKYMKINCPYFEVCLFSTLWRE